jgi:hypothetical protein
VTVGWCKQDLAGHQRVAVFGPAKWQTLDDGLARRMALLGRDVAGDQNRCREIAWQVREQLAKRAKSSTGSASDDELGKRPLHCSAPEIRRVQHATFRTLISSHIFFRLAHGFAD